MSDTRAATLRTLLVASSAASMLCVAPALASEAGAPTAPVAADEPQATTDLGTVDVNGHRVRREPTSPEFVAPLVDTPRSITVIPQQIIEQTGATSLQDILRTSPGITFGAGEGGQPLADRPFIRGQASGNNVFVDGIRDTGGQQREVFNLEQVEVIKGPDSVYSGRGSGGGSINLGSKSAKLTDFTHVSLGVGTDAYLRGTIDQNWAIGDTAGLRINLMGASGDVAARDGVDYDKWGLGLSLAAGLGTHTTATASYYHLTSNQMPDYGIPLFTKTGVRTTDSGILDVAYDRFYGIAARDYLTNEVDSFTLAFEHRFSETLTLRNTSRFAQTLNDYIVTNPGDGGAAQTFGGVSWMKRGTKSRWNPATTWANVTDLSGEFLTGGVRHSVNLGTELTRETNRNATYSVYGTTASACPVGWVYGATAAAALTTLNTVGAGDCTPTFAPNPEDPWTGVINKSPVSSTRTDTIGVSAFDSIALSERFIVNLGVRWDRYSNHGTTVNATQALGLWTVNPLVPAPGSTLAAGIVVLPERTWDFVNYQIGGVFKPTEDTSLYASWSTASTPPTISAGDQNGAGGTITIGGVVTVLDPEDTENYEIGAKANLFDDRLALSAAAFYLTRKNAALLVDVGVYAQVGEVEVRGIELGISGNITRQWQVFGGYTWMDSELVRGAVTATGGLNVNQGDPLANTPAHSASLFTTYRVSRPLSVGGGVYYVSDSFGGNQGGAGGGANRIYAPAYTRVDLFASYDLTERATVQINVQNATDEAYILRTNGVHHADPAPGRSATIALNYRF